MISLGRIFGVDVRAHYSSLFVFGALAGMLAYGYLPQLAPATPALERIAVAAILAAVLFGSLLAHELGHAVIARRRGQAVANVTMYLFGGTTHAEDLHATAGDEIAVGLGGPAVSAAIAVLFLSAGLLLLRVNERAGILLADVGVANALLAAFNILPGYPMDGGRVLRGIFWKFGGNAVSATKRAALGGRLIAYLTMAAGAAAIAFGDALDGIWILGAGWFLSSLAHAYYRSLMTRMALDGLTAKDFCAALPTLQTDDTVASAATHFGAGAVSRVLAVLFGERPAGLVSDVDVAQADAGEAATTPVSVVMRRLADVAQVDLNVPALDTYSAVTAGPSSAAVVCDEAGCFFGLVRREDIVRYIDMVEELGNSAAASRQNLRGLVKTAGHLQPDHGSRTNDF
ncbi:MAG TPA: hypothetical protein VN934_02430 [Candidatus Tumulicola sp.]|nr:hypothetical protein [Candidatus Tumulicola sp.]